MSFDRFRYELQLMGKKVILTPILVMVGFALFSLLLHYLKVLPERFLLGGIEMILPIAVGVVVGNVAIQDPALELQLTMPRHYDRTAIQRLFLIIGWTTCIALLSSLLLSLLGLAYMPDILKSWSPFASFFTMQLAWLAVLAYWTSIVNTIMPIGIGCLMADRLQRDHRTRVDELFTSMPGALSTRLLGKYFGGIAAILIPLFAFYLLGVGYILIQTQNLLTLPLSLITFVTIVLPGTLFVSAFSLACTSLLWVPLYQFLFICYWFWGNVLSPNTGIPTISHTLLTPIGDYMAQGIFGAYVSDINATPQLGFASLLTLIGFATFALFVLYGFLKWQRAIQ